MITGKDGLSTGHSGQPTRTELAARPLPPRTPILSRDKTPNGNSCRLHRSTSGGAAMKPWAWLLEGLSPGYPLIYSINGAETPHSLPCT